MKRIITSMLLFGLVTPAVQATTIIPDIVFAIRDEIPADGSPDSSSTGPMGTFSTLITNENFVDEIFFEYAVGTESVASATLSIEMLLYDELDINKTFDISTYNNGIGAVQLGLFGAGDYLTTAPVTEFFTLNTIVLDISALYNNAVAASDNFLGFRLHNVISDAGGIRQAVYNDSSLKLNEIPVPAAAWLFGTALIGLFGLKRRRKVPNTT